MAPTIGSSGVIRVQRITASAVGSPEAMPWAKAPLAVRVFAVSGVDVVGEQAAAVDAVNAPKMPRRVILCVMDVFHNDDRLACIELVLHHIKNYKAA